MSRLKGYLTTIAGTEEKAVELATAAIGSAQGAKELLEGKITLSAKLSKKLLDANEAYDPDTAVQLSKADHVDYTKANAKGDAAKVKTGKSPAFGDHSGAVRQREF